MWLTDVKYPWYLSSLEVTDRGMIWESKCQCGLKNLSISYIIYHMCTEFLYRPSTAACRGTAILIAPALVQVERSQFC